MSYNCLPGITKIEIISCSKLPADIMMRSITTGIPIAIVAEAKLIAFVGRPELKWEGTIINGSRQEKTTFEFSSVEHLPEHERIAFIVSTAGDRKYIVGTKEPNYPIISYNETTGKTTGEAAVRTYKITHIAQKSVIQCVF